MSTFKLIIEVSKHDRENALHGKNLVITKSSSSSDKGNTSWVSTRPFGTTSISWEAKYGVYASRTDLKDGFTIDKLSSKPGVGDSKGIQEQMEYIFTDDATFNDGQKTLEPGNYGAKNDWEEDESLTMGLMQEVSISGKKVMSPINAVTVPRGQILSSAPVEAISLFASSEYEEGAIISTVGTETFTYEYQDGVKTVTCHYDNAMGYFVEGPYSA